MTAAEELHFRRAAEILFVAQSALSHGIQRLECKIGTPLFVRTTRSVRLTEAGKQLVPDAQRALHYAERFRNRAAGIAEGLVGSITIGYTPLVANAAAAIVQGFTTAFPAIEVIHNQQYSQRLDEAVSGRVIDCAFVYSHGIPESLSSQEAFDMPLVAVVGPHHPLASRKSVTLPALTEYALVIVDDASGRSWQALLEEILRRNGVTATFSPIPDPVGRFPLELIETSRELVVLTSVDWADPTLRRIPTIPPLAAPIDLVWRSDTAKPVLDGLRRFLDERLVPAVPMPLA